MRAVTDTWLTDWMPSERFPVYTRARADQVMAEPCSPLGWTLLWEQAMVPGWRDACLRSGLLLERELPEHRAPVCGSFGGYFYVNVACARTGAARVPDSSAEAVDRVLFGGRPDVSDLPAHVPHPDDTSPEALAGPARPVERAPSAEDIADLSDRADAARRSRTDLTYLNPAELLERARGLLPLLRETFAGHVAAGVCSPAGPDMVDSAGASRALWDLSRTVAHSPDLELYFDGGVPGIIERLEGSPSEDAKAFLDDFDTLLYQYGSRGPGEWDIGAEVWETNPELALSHLERLRSAPDGEDPRREPPATDREAAIARERAGANAVRITNEIRIAIRELGRQMADAHHIADQSLVMMLTADELDDFVAHPEAYGLKLAERAREHAALADLEPPFFIVGTVPPLSDWPKRTNASPG